MTFKEFQEINKKRDLTAWNHLQIWKYVDWSNAIAGESGELCNLVKKMKRDGNITLEQLSKEIADIITYCTLFAIKLNIDLEETLIKKFNEVSDRIKSNVKINL